MFLLDATIKYKYTVTADGYVPYVETIKVPIGNSTRKDFVLTKVTDAARVMTEAKAEPSIEAYNAGGALANSGDQAGALLLPGNLATGLRCAVTRDCT